MKKILSLLLIAVMAATCMIASLSASAAGYADVVDLLPASADVIEQNSTTQNGKVDFTLSDGSLSLTRADDSALAWPSIVYLIDKEVDLSKTPYLHMSFETSGVGDRGVNGMLYYTVDGGEEAEAQLSAIGGNGVDDFRDTGELYVNLAEYLNVSGKITIVRMILSVYGGIGETITWRALALAEADGNAAEESSEASAEESSEAPAEESSEASAEASSEASAATSSTSSTAATSSTASSNASSAAASDAPDSGLSTPIIILIAVLCAAVVAAVVIVIVKKKKS